MVLTMKAWILKKKPRGFVDQWLQIRFILMEPDPDLVKSRIQIRIKVKKDIRIHIKMMRIRNLEGQHSDEIRIKVKREIRIRIPIKMMRTTFC